MAHLAHQLRASERDFEEERQSRDRGVERDGRDAAVHTVQLITTLSSRTAAPATQSLRTPRSCTLFYERCLQRHFSRRRISRDEKYPRACMVLLRRYQTRT